MIEEGETISNVMDKTTSPTQIMIRVNPDLRKRIEDQIASGKYTSFADFGRAAIYEKLNREEYMLRFHECLLADLENPDTRRRFRKLLSEILVFDHQPD